MLLLISHWAGEILFLYIGPTKLHVDSDDDCFVQSTQEAWYAHLAVSDFIILPQSMQHNQADAT